MSLPYDLALRLKKAGFPHSESWIFYNEGTPNQVFISESGPTLEELIDACGERFDMLENTKDGWRAISSEVVPRAFWSKNKEEAVAYLWLALNEKVDNFAAKE